MSLSSHFLVNGRRDRRGLHPLAAVATAIAVATFGGAGVSATAADGTGNSGADAVSVTVPESAESPGADIVSVTAGAGGVAIDAVSVTVGGEDPIASALGSGSSGDGQRSTAPRSDDPVRDWTFADDLARYVACLSAVLEEAA